MNTHNGQLDSESPDHPGTGETPETTRREADTAGNSYEENPKDDKALLEAAQAIPVKDYSDYEIEIETKTEFKDALFGSDDDLDMALETAEQQKVAPEIIEQAPEEKEPEEEISNRGGLVHQYDFTQYLQMSASVAEPISGVNQTPTAAMIEVPPLADEQLSLIAEPGNEPAVDDSHVEATEDVTDKPKSFAEKLKQKAKQQFDKSKAHVEEYLGKSLPSRELPLGFTFPIQKSKKDLDGVASGYTIRKLFEDKGKSILSVFKQADQDLAKINRCQMLDSSRHSLLDAYCEQLIPKTIEVINSFERKPNLAGDGKRLALSEHSDAALKHLILGYKQVYCSYYEAANVIYGPQRNAANNVLSRLIELLLIEARLCVALHLNFPASSIKAMNKLFTAARLYEPELVNRPYTAMSDGDQTSMLAMYFHFQVLLVLDASNLSTLLYRVSGPYLQEKLPLLQLCDAEAEPESHRQYWAIHHEHTGLPRMVSGIAVGEDGFAPTVIETTHFFNAIKSDYIEMVQHAGDPSWKSSNPLLAAIKPHYAMTILAALNQQVYQHEQSRLAARYSIYQPARIRSFSGIEGIFTHLNYTYALATKKPERKGEAVKDLPDRPKADRAKWSRAKEEDGIIYMQLDEAETVAQLDIGQIVLLLEIDLEEEADSKSDNHKLPETTTLGLISGLERTQGKKLNLTIARLADTCTHATLVTPKGTEKSVLLALDSHGLLLVTDHTVDAGAPGSLQLPDESAREINSATPQWLTTKYQILRIT